MFKKFFVMFLLVALAVTPAHAFKTKAQQDAHRAVMAEQGFNQVANEGYFSISSAQTVTPSNTTGTGAYTLGFCPSTIVEFPCKMTLQYLGTNKVYVTKYQATSAGVRATTATCAFLMAPGNTSGTPVIGDKVEMIFYQAPQISFGGGGSAATFSIMIETLDSDPFYQ
jgi:hypothetical protein